MYKQTSSFFLQHSDIKYHCLLEKNHLEVFWIRQKNLLFFYKKQWVAFAHSEKLLNIFHKKIHIFISMFHVYIVDQIFSHMK